MASLTWHARGQIILAQPNRISSEFLITDYLQATPASAQTSAGWRFYHLESWSRFAWGSRHNTENFVAMNLFQNQILIRLLFLVFASTCWPSRVRRKYLSGNLPEDRGLWSIFDARQISGLLLEWVGGGDRGCLLVEKKKETRGNKNTKRFNVSVKTQRLGM